MKSNNFIQLMRLLTTMLVGLFVIHTAFAYDFYVDGICYYKNSDGVSVTVTYERYPDSSSGYKSYSYDLGWIEIPETVTYSGKTYTVTVIDARAFYGCSGFRGSLTIPNSVTTIGDYAFSGCSGLTSLTIGNSVASIRQYAFLACSGLTSVKWNAINCADFTDNAPFKANLINGLTNIKSFVFGDGVQKIPQNLCYNLSGLTGTLTIPNSVTTIGSGAFYGCSGLTGSLTIPNSVTCIGEHAFKDCSGLTGSLTIPNSVTSIGASTFSGCSGLTGSLTIPNSVKTIGERAFSGCRGFTGSLNIPDSVTSIGMNVFENCSGFTGSLTIGKSVTSIGDYAFSGCTALSSIECLKSSITARSSTFNDVPVSINLIVPLYAKPWYATNSPWSRFKNIIMEGQIDSIKVNDITLKIGGSKQLNAVVYPSDATDKTLTWKSSNTTVATVESDGKVTAKASGKSTITVQANDGSGVEATCIVTVRTMSLNKKNTTIYIGGTETLQANINPSSTQSVVWKSSNKAVATVDTQGKVTPISVGEARITATLTDGVVLTDTCHISVKAYVSDVILNKTDLTICVGESERLISTVLPVNANNRTLEWKTSNSNVATVDNEGVISALSVGSATITAKTTDGTNLSASCNVTVMPLCYLQADTIHYTRGMSNTTIELPLELINRKDVSGLQFDLTLPSGVSMAKRDGLPDIWLESTRKSRNHSVDVEYQSSNGCYRVLVSSPTGQALKGDHGTLLHVNLQVNQYETTSKLYSLKYSNLIITSPDEEENRQNEWYSRLSYEYIVGDANADVTVDVADYVVTASKVLNRTPSGYFFKDAADVNSDGSINVTDLIGITNIALGRRPSQTRRSPALGDSSISSPYILQCSTSKSEKALSFNLINELPLAGLQFDLELPRGINVKKVETLGRANGLDVSYGIMPDGHVRVLLSSFNECDVKPGDGDIIRVSLDDIDYGYARLDGIILTERNLKEHSQDGFEIEMNTTAVTDVSSHQLSIWSKDGNLFIDSPHDGKAQLVEVNGLSVMLNVKAGRNVYNLPMRGLYIVKMDGESVKVIL